MVTGTSHSNIHPEVEKTFSCRSSNRITKKHILNIEINLRS